MNSALKTFLIFVLLSITISAVELAVNDNKCISLGIGSKGSEYSFQIDFEGTESWVSSDFCAKSSACGNSTKKGKKATNNTAGPVNMTVRIDDKSIKMSFKINNKTKEANSTGCGENVLSFSPKSKSNLINSLNEAKIIENKKFYFIFDETTKTPNKIQFGDVSNQIMGAYDFYDYPIEEKEKGWSIKLNNIKAGLNTNGTDISLVDSNPRKASFSWTQKFLSLPKEDIVEITKILKKDFNTSCKGNSSELVVCEFRKSVLNVSEYNQAGLPNIFLVFDEKKEQYFELWPNEYINLKSCKQTSNKPNNKTGKKKNKEPTYFCEIYLNQHEKNGEAIIGTLFTNKFITVFDFENKSVSIGESKDEEDVELGKQWRKTNKEIVEQGLLELLLIFLGVVFLICLGILLNVFVHKNYRRAYEGAISRGSGRGTFKEKFKRSLEETHADNELKTEDEFEKKF